MRHTIHHWPLDSSFRLILETWLSYIQPWRYTDWRHKNMRSPVSRDNEERTRTVDRRWLNFIAENLLSYSVIFRQLLPRFTRLDLATPKNAHMLFRVTKVWRYCLVRKRILTKIVSILGTFLPKQKAPLTVITFVY
jgi:sphingomyelin phosphodiesterase 4